MKTNNFVQFMLNFQCIKYQHDFKFVTFYEFVCLDDVDFHFFPIFLNDWGSSLLFLFDETNGSASMMLHHIVACKLNFRLV